MIRMIVNNEDDLSSSTDLHTLYIAIGEHTDPIQVKEIETETGQNFN